MYPPVSFENASLRREIESLRKKIELLSEESTNADVVAHYEGIKASLEGRIRTLTSWKDKEVKWKKNVQRELKIEKDKRRCLDRFKDNEVTSHEMHLPDDTCPKCGDKDIHRDL